MQLSPHFTLLEFTNSSDHPGLVSANTDAATPYLGSIATCASRAEDIRSLFNAPVIIHSGFRSKALNDAVGSQDHSQHMIGEAFDFHVEGFLGTHELLMQALTKIEASRIEFHQLLIEGECLHFGIYKPFQPNGEVAWWADGEKVVYRPYKDAA